MAEEKMTVEEPTAEPTQTPESASNDILSKLKELEIDTPERLEGIAQASSQVGNMARELGMTRKELAALKEQMASRPSENYDYDNTGVDLGSAIRKETRNVLSEFWNEQTTRQQQAEEAYYGELDQIYGDSRFVALKDPWEKHFNSPSVQQKIRRGKTSPVKEYSRIKDAYINILEEQLSNVSKAAPRTKPPHIESGETETIPLPTVDEERKHRIKNKTDPAKGFAGTDEDIMGLVKEIMPADDPFYRLG